MDGIFPALLQEGRSVVLYLVRIFRACLDTGHVPTMWRQIKVVFIPKPDRNSYGGPRDFRHINLTSFLLKTMERLVDRFLRDQDLALVPLHPNQHAYQAGNSLETALKQLVIWVEKALDQQETLGVFLDIEVACNDISYNSVCAALVRHGIDHTIVWCINATLEGCLAAVTLIGFSRRVAVSRGVFSPLLWCQQQCTLLLLVVWRHWPSSTVAGDAG
jgi:hypothetical protein